MKKLTGATLRKVFLKLLPVMSFVFLFCCAAAFGRAGGGGGGGFGGGGFGGGGGSFGGGGYGGRGGGAGIFILYFQYWYVSIPLTVLVIYIQYKLGNGANEYYQGSVIREARRKQDGATKANALRILRGRDPDFAVLEFQERAKNAFMKIQTAWCSHDLSTVRHFISDGVYERFSLQLAEQKQRGIRDHMENIQILEMDFAELHSDKVYDKLTLMIRASAVDYRVDARSGKRISGSSSAEEFIEYWTYLRRPEATTIAKGGLIEGNCPNCGTALEINEAAKCPSCGALIRSGKYDWVLSEITQGSEWRPTASAYLPGVNDLRVRDPQFSMQQLEDFASVAFYRWMAASRQGRVEPLAKVASDSFCKGVAEELRPDNTGKRVFAAEPAIGGVDTIGVVEKGNSEQALVEVTYSCRLHEMDAGGKEKQLRSARVVRRIFLFARRKGAVTSVENGLSSAHCHSCGAPAGESAGGKCAYCGASLTDGSKWILVDIVMPMSNEAKALGNLLNDAAGVSGAPLPPVMNAGVSAQKKPKGGVETAAWMVKVMLADGIIDDRERQMLAEYTSARGLPADQLDMFIESMRGGEVEAPEPANKEEAKDWIEQMVAMAMIDGKLTKSEHQLIVSMGTKLGFSAYDIKILVTKTRGRLFREAKEKLKKMRREGMIK